jgi:hypothetical protein
VVAIGIATMLLLAACGSDGSGDAGNTAAIEPSTTQWSSTEPPATEPPATNTVATQPDDTEPPATEPPSGSGESERSSIRGLRYCEILLSVLDGEEVTTEVWGTQGLSLCPAEQWEALDPEAIGAEYAATNVRMNGPRAFVIDGSSGVQLPESEQRTYGNLEMRLLATVDISPEQLAGRSDPYTPITVLRTNIWEFHAGSEIYELFDPDGNTYVMQAYSQIVDPDLDESDLAFLGDRLELPDGWSYASRVLDDDLLLRAEGEATVIQDELESTYQQV